MAMFEEPTIIKTIEMHTSGEPVRIIESGYPKVVGKTILEQIRHLREKFDHYRKLVIMEPRGHFDMYGFLVVEPTLPAADMAVIFMHNEGYSTMCGHGIISLGRYAVDYGLIKSPTSPETRVNIQCPCGIVTAHVEYNEGKTGSVRFISVPAFVYCMDLEVKLEKFGTINVDICYGGAYYVFLSAKQIGLNVETSPVRDLVDAARVIKEATNLIIKIKHPGNEDLGFLYGVIITDGEDKYSEEPTSNICIFADEQVDRSPCGSGVTARIALQYHKGLIGLNQTRCFQSSRTKGIFKGRAVSETTVENYKAVRVEVSGRGYYTGSTTLTLETGDTMAMGRGFLIK